jgi:putative transposase
MKVRIRKTRARQQRIEFCGHGGRRKGAGRKRRGGRKRVAHCRRPELEGWTPVHVTLRLVDGLPSLRNYERCKVLRKALCEGGGKPDFRVVELSVQGNHVHSVCEARSKLGLSRGIQGLKHRVTRGLNRLWGGRRGTVWADRYHLEVLRTPRQVRNALCYVLNNDLRHGLARRRGCVDVFSSGRYFDGWATAPPDEASREGEDAPVAPATSWLLTVGWRRHGLIGLDEVPVAGRPGRTGGSSSRPVRSRPRGVQGAGVAR